MADSADSQPGLPPMRFDDGDVIIKISKDPKEWLILHSEVLRTGSPILEPSLSEDWAPAKEQAKDPGTEKPIYCMALTAQDGVMLLSSKADFSPHEILDDGEVAPGGGIFGSDLDQLELDGYIFGALADHTTCATAAATDIKTMFAFIYNIPVTLNDIIAIPKFRREDCFPNSYYWNAVCCRVANIACISNFYGCLDRVAPKLVAVLLAEESIWIEIARADSRREFFRLAVTLRCREIYDDCLRHWIRQAEGPHDYERIASLTNSDLAEVENNVKLSHDRADRTVAALEPSLRDLGLAQVKISPQDRIHTNFSNAYHHMRGPQKSDKLALQIQTITPLIWSQYITQATNMDAKYLTRGRMHGGTKPRALHKNFRIVMEDILQFAKKEDPSKLFGHRPAHPYASIFATTPAQAKDHRDGVQESLSGVVREAAGLIVAAFEFNEEPWTTTVSCAARCGRFTVQNRRYGGTEQLYTHSSIDISKLPWLPPDFSFRLCTDERQSAMIEAYQPWPEVSAIPEVNMTPATGKWTGVLEGMTPDAELVDVDNQDAALGWKSLAFHGEFDLG